MREILLEISPAACANQALIGTATSRRAFAVTSVKLINNIHSLGDLPEGREAVTVQALVIAVINEYLCRACIRSGHGVGDIAARVALHDRIVLDISLFPRVRNLGIRTQPELRHESRQNAEKS